MVPQHPDSEQICSSSKYLSAKIELAPRPPRHRAARYADAVLLNEVGTIPMGFQMLRAPTIFAKTKFIQAELGWNLDYPGDKQNSVNYLDPALYAFIHAHGC